MPVSWVPVIYLDIFGSAVTLLLAFCCVFLAWKWAREDGEEVLRQYILLLTLAIVIFAVSRSFGHLVKQILILNNNPQIWQQIAPFSGAVNSATFIVIFAFSMYFHRFRKIHFEIENYQNNLETLVEERTLKLEEEITERKRVESDLLSEKEGLAVTLRSIGDGVITTDIYGNIVLINKAAEELTGWSQAEAQGRALTEVYHIIKEENGKPCDNPVEQVLATGQIVDLPNNTILVAGNGEKRNIADSGAPIRNQHSEIIGVVLVFRDVTNHRLMEQEFLKVQKLESVGVLAGGIAHDFNNILAAILGNLNLASDLTAPGSQLSEMLSDIEKAALRAKGLTQQLLTFSKGGEPVKKVASIAEVIRDSADFVLHGSNVRCDYSIDDDLRLVEIDPDQMSQVIQNIILNAKEAMPEGGVIEVTCRNFGRDEVHALPLEKRNYVEITVSDQGTGIPSGQMNRVFEPYFTTKQVGSGLGLAVTHSIIHQHRGYITVKAGEERGTVFYIYLPAISGQEKEPAEESRKPGNNRGRGKILVMDDEEMVRNVSHKLLVHLGYEVELAEDGEEVISKYKEAMAGTKPVDLVIMDLTVPGGMGGKEAAKKLHRLDPGARMVVSSGYSNDPVLAHYRDYGFSAAILKPYQFKELNDLLSELLA